MIAAELASEGVRVAIMSRDAGRVEQTARELGILGFAGDISADGGGRQAVKQATAILGAVPDVLVTNTGGSKPAASRR